jgi:uncharacterized damage-inducible protein DinB
MPITHFQRLYAYNNWAWDHVFTSLEKIDITDYLAERPFFWGSLHGLAVHGLTAEWLWLARLMGNSPTNMLDPAGYPDFAAVKTHWLQVRGEWGDYLDGLTNADLPATLEYRNTRGHGFTLVVQDVLHHVFNHATEHRSQMTPILHQLGHPTPALDYIFFAVRHA